MVALYRTSHFVSRRTLKICLWILLHLILLLSGFSGLLPWEEGRAVRKLSGHTSKDFQTSKDSFRTQQDFWKPKDQSDTALKIPLGTFLQFRPEQTFQDVYSPLAICLKRCSVTLECLRKNILPNV